MAAPVFEAHVDLKCQNTLGEGILWDPKTQLLHWIDIDKSEVHSFNPESRQYSVDSYPETTYIGAIAPCTDGSGFVAAFTDSITIIPTPSTPTGTSVSPVPTVRKSLKTVAQPLAVEHVKANKVRFNDGACDPRGRFVIGSMTRPEITDGITRGQLWRIESDGTREKLLDEVATSNGIGWSLDTKTLYYIDSGLDLISAFDYDVASGSVSNRRTFAPSPPAINSGDSKSQGVFDGLVVDGVGNVWAARWSDSRLIGYTPSGEIIAHIYTPKCKSPTIPCFGGKDMTTMYIATAHSKLAGKGEIQDEFPDSGNLFKIECGPGSPLGQILGASWKGRDRYTFGA